MVTNVTFLKPSRLTPVRSALRSHLYASMLALLFAAHCLSAPNGWIQHNTYGAPSVSQYTTSLISGPNGALWFLDTQGNAIGTISESGVVTEYQIPWSHYPNFMALGPDGALWFTENEVGIGRYSPASGFQEFAMPALATLPGEQVFLGSITAGPDGALWFLQGQACGGTPQQCVGPNVGRISTSGAVTLNPITAYLGYPSDIVAGPDGALWFTEAYPTNAIGRITTDGVVTQYSLPANFSNPAALTVGSDGALWFLQIGLYNGTASEARVGRITTSGSFSGFTVPVSSGVTINGESNLIAGSDGALWFELITSSESTTNLWRMTTAGTFTVFNGQALGFTDTGVYSSGTVGPDGALWFTANEQVVRVPACGLGLRASFANSTLTLSFNGGSPTSTVWETGFYYGSGTFQGLWSIPLGPIVQSDPYTSSFSLPSLGYIAPVSVFRDAASSEPLCAEWAIVSTGGSGGVNEDEVNSSVVKMLTQ